MTDYFDHIVDSLSWSSLKHDLYGLKFYYVQVLNKPWPGADLVKPPKSHTLPDIITVPQAQQIFMATRVLSYRVFFFTLYSLGLRLGEGLRLQAGDIDADRMRVQVRNAKGNRDRFVPLPAGEHLADIAPFLADPPQPRIALPQPGSADSKKPTWPPPRWIVVASRPPCARSPAIAV
ncbi:hypothetical protein NTG1052_900001 [Candidatus Nitrotoga sp. 1052]|nr:hypothetical protein NTG1052_900001 [Candidatus Nitrotoga sp. 1052]